MKETYHIVVAYRVVVEYKVEAESWSDAYFKAENFDANVAVTVDDKAREQGCIGVTVEEVGLEVREEE